MCIPPQMLKVTRVTDWCGTSSRKKYLSRKVRWLQSNLLAKFTKVHNAIHVVCTAMLIFCL